MSYVDQLIAENESVVRINRDHWITLLATAVVDGLICVVIVGISVLLISMEHSYGWYGLIVLLAPVGQALIRFWIWTSRQYVITTRRILQVSGVLSKRVSDTSLDKINDIVMEQSALGRILGYGDLKIITGTESGTDVFRRISNPIQFKKSMLNQREGLGSVAILEERAGQVLSATVASVNDVPELIAGLDELRQKGLISDADFERKKQQLLDKI